MKKLKTKWLLGAIVGMFFLLICASPVSAELKTFLVKANDGSYYEYNSVDLNNSYLSEQLNAGGAGSKMYRHFNGVLSTSGKVIGLGDDVKGYMDYPQTALMLLKYQMWGKSFDINAYFTSKESVKLTEPVSNVKVVDKNGNVSDGGGGDDEDDDDNEIETGEISYKEPDSAHIVLDQATATHYVNNQVLLTANEGVKKGQIEQLIAANQGTVVGYIELTNDFQIEYPASKTKSELKTIVAQLKSSSLVAEAEINYLFETVTNAVPNDAKWASEEWSSTYPEGTNWGMEAINAMGAWEHYNQMQYVKVGVIDSMFDTNHEDLNFTPDGVWNNPENITNQHGTHVSGTIAAAYSNGKGIAGVAPKTILYGYSLNGKSDSNVAQLQGAMKFKYALAKVIASNCKVINVSWGYDEEKYDQLDTFEQFEFMMMVANNNARYGEYLEKWLDKDYDFVIVQAAGNGSRDALNWGMFSGIVNERVKKNIIVVSGIENNGSRYDWWFERVHRGYKFYNDGNFGQRVDVVAPGVNIYSTIPGSRYEGGWNGTSMSTPHVSGIAAMLYSVNPGLNGVQVKQIIKDTADTSVGKSVAGNNAGDTVDAYYLVNADAAVDMAIATTGEVQTPVGRNTGIVMSNVSSSLDDNAIGGAEITAYKVNVSDGNIGEYNASTGTDLEGNFELILDEGQYYVRIYSEGFVPLMYLDVKVIAGEVNYLQNARLSPTTGGQRRDAIIKGTVKDALTGNIVPEVTIKFRENWDARSGDYLKDSAGNTIAVKTDANGTYQLGALEGAYTAELSKEGYVTGYLNLIAVIQEKSQDAVITPVLSSDQYRVVLTWSETPYDLDSHLTGPLANGGRFHVFYSNRVAYDGSEKVAELDLDDRYSYGPETITTTLTQSGAGVYRYSVHNYSNRDSSTSKALSLSGAQVKLYNGNVLIGTFNVPVNQGGTLWEVFELENGTVRNINTMEYISNPGSVN